MNRVSTGFKLSNDAKSMLLVLSRDLGISQTAVMERAIRDVAKAEGLQIAQVRTEAADIAARKRELT